MMDAMGNTIPADALPMAQLRPLICAAADRHKLPPAYVYAIVMAESAGNPWAFNFEPDFQKRYLDGKPMATRGLAREDESVARATSWGLMQIMGQVAREHGFDGKYLPQLCDPVLGLEYGCRHLARKAEKYFDAHGWAGVFAAYNAGSPRMQPGKPTTFVNQTYVDRVFRHAKDFDETEPGTGAPAKARNQTSARAA